MAPKSPRRFFRSSVLMLIGAVLLCVWVTLTRDRDTKRLFLSSAASYCPEIREHWDRARALPSELEDPQDPARRVPLEFYADSAARFYVTRTQEPVIVGYTPMAQMVAVYNGRGVIFFQDGRVTARWVREGDFQRLLAAQELKVESVVEEARSRPPILPD